MSVLPMIPPRQDNNFTSPAPSICNAKSRNRAITGIADPDRKNRTPSPCRLNVCQAKPVSQEIPIHQLLIFSFSKSIAADTAAKQNASILHVFKYNSPLISILPILLSFA